MRILTTNWINILGVFVSMLLYSVIFNQLNNDLGYNIFQSIVGGLILICLYGMMFWGLFVISLIVLDLLLIVRNQNNLRIKLSIEWAIISAPFIYWAIRYQEWVFLVSVLAFLLTQLFREKIIVKATQS
jgi:hypothetical protein